MDASVHRRLTVAVCWALARRAALDGQERFEESYALNEEFREWLLCLEDNPELLGETVLMVPATFPCMAGPKRTDSWKSKANTQFLIASGHGAAPPFARASRPEAVRLS